MRPLVMTFDDDGVDVIFFFILLALLYWFVQRGYSEKIDKLLSDELAIENLDLKYREKLQ